MQRFRSSSFWVLMGIFTVSVILSLYRINECQMTVDEFFSINIAQRSLSEFWRLEKNAGFYFNNIPPFYETLLHFVWSISKGSLIWARLFSASFSVMSLLLIFLISKLLFDSRVGLIAAFFTSLNYSHIFFSKMIRCYSLLNFLTLLSFYIFFKIAIGGRTGTRYKIILACINIAILYTFYFGAIVILLELLLSRIFLSGRALRRTWFWLLSSFIFFLPWLGYFINDFHALAIVRFRISAMQSFFNVLLSRFSQGIFHDTGMLIFYFAAVFYSLAYGFVLLSRRDKKGLVIIALAAIFLLAISIINWLTVEIKDYARARYSFPYIFPVFILTGFFMKKIYQANKYAGASVFVALLIYSAFSVGGYLKSPAQQFWPAQLAPLVDEVREFPVSSTDKVTIEIENYFFAPVFVYYFYGPAYFRSACFPFAGANLGQLNGTLKTNYKVYSNITFDESYRFLHSIPDFTNSNWLFLIYSNWLAFDWGKPFREVYEEKLRKYNLQDKISLVKKDVIGAFTLEIYKVDKK